MVKAKRDLAETEIGRFVCPGTHSSVPARAGQPLAFIHWPLVIKNCPSCGRKHSLELKDVEHPPVYGYE
jgi:hypothetical protein